MLKKISLVIPVFNEEESISNLINSIEGQSFQPAEVVFVDGGSTDKTIEIIESITKDQTKYRLIKTPKASPGKGRNIGVENSRFDWIAFTDAGILLDKDWLKKLAERVKKNPGVQIVYGNYAPILDTFFEKCAAFAYVAAQRKNKIRGKFIASSLFKKEVVKKIGNFPDLRAAEDLMFMARADELNFLVAYEPEAMVFWQLRPDLSSTFEKFIVYSKHNVLAGRAWDWHYGVAKQYLIALLFVILAFVNSWWWLIMVVVWLFARTAKRILAHRFEWGLKPLLNPFYFVGITFTILIVDLATFIGWEQALLHKENTGIACYLT